MTLRPMQLISSWQLRVPPRKSRWREVQDGEVIVDVDAQGTIIGLEFVCASRILPEEFLRA